MEEIKVGEYIRSTNGVIAKVVGKEEEDYEERGHILYELDREIFDETEGFEEYSIYALPDQFVKHSSNIIDLIEPGDYVNGCEVENVTDEHIEIYYNMRFTRERFNDWVKSIVTKEQFELVEYNFDN